MELKNGTSSVSIQDRSFGERYAYYVNIVNSKVSQNWYKSEADPLASMDKSATIIFDIDRDGVPSNARVETRSGSPSLDLSALRAVQRVDGFGPCPQATALRSSSPFTSARSNLRRCRYSFDYLTVSLQVPRTAFFASNIRQNA